MIITGETLAVGQTNDALHPGPSVPGHTIQYNEQQHTWIIDQTLLPCSPTGYACLRLLLEQAERCVPYAHFIAQFQEAPLAEARAHKQARMKVAHVMSNLRAKLWPLGLDIGSVMGVGYILLREEEAVPSLEESEKPYPHHV